MNKVKVPKYLGHTLYGIVTLIKLAYILLDRLHIIDKPVITMSQRMTKPTKWHVHPAKTHFILGIRPV